MNRRKLDKTFILILAILCGAGIVSWRVFMKVYRQSDTVSIHQFPSAIDGWISEDIPISDDDKALLETDNVFVRRYTASKGDEVYLFVVYSQNNRKVSHPPEICYTGGGATILDSVPDTLEMPTTKAPVPVNRLTVERGEENQIFVYWFKAGNEFTPSYWKQQWLIATKTLMGKPASSALIRISASVKNGNSEKATRLVKSFGGRILPELQHYLP